MPRALAFIVTIQILLTIAMLAALDLAYAHPEDDFCEPGAGLNPQLCQELAAINRAAPKALEMWQDEQGQALSGFKTFGTFTSIGVRHILPGGLDHILFVLALFLGVRRIRTLVRDISIFTLAHTVTLGLAATAVINPPASLVEPFIALSIAVVGVENIRWQQPKWWRPLVIFGFGLCHGLGFAGFVREVVLQPQQFWASLLVFNLGVEVGQLSVVGVA
ncbi:MAG: HupE/UreJ family protein, partial [Pseudomonadota bacterium]